MKKINTCSSDFSDLRKENAEPYLADGRPIWLIGLSFDSQTRYLVDCAAKEFCEIHG